MLTPIWRETQEGETQTGRSHGPETRCSLCDDNACCSAAWWVSLEAHSGHSSTQAAGRSQDDCALQKGQNKLNVQQRRLWPEPIFPSENRSCAFGGYGHGSLKEGFSLKEKKSNNRAHSISCFSCPISKKNNIR